MEQQKPSWLSSLLSEKFFIPCALHESAKKNLLCLDCCLSACSHCLHFHPAHRLLQIRRYVYQDAVRLDDMQNLFDCTFIQLFITNGAKVVLLKQKSQNNSSNGSGDICNCNTCSTNIHEPNQFCSLACKIEYALKNEGSISSYLYAGERSPLPNSVVPRIEEKIEIHNSQETPSSVLDSGTVSCRTSSASGSHGDAGGLTVASTATTEQSSGKIAVESSSDGNNPLSFSKRKRKRKRNRKGKPHRSPSLVKRFS